MKKHRVTATDVVKKYGTDGVDYLMGSPSVDTIIFGLEGDDRIYDANGLDQLSPTNDRYYGNEGNDQITSWLGDDFLFGNTGNDTLRVEHHAGKVVLDGGVGDDTAVLNLFTPHLMEVIEKDDRTVYVQGDSRVVVMDDVEHEQFTFDLPGRDF